MSRTYQVEVQAQIVTASEVEANSEDEAIQQMQGELEVDVGGSVTITNVTAFLVEED